jgi:hypothetical protein
VAKLRDNVNIAKRKRKPSRIIVALKFPYFGIRVHANSGHNSHGFFDGKKLANSAREYELSFSSF